MLDAIEQDLASARAAFTELVEKDVPAFNRDARRLRLVPLDAQPARRGEATTQP